jgi:hypothetical protein
MTRTYDAVPTALHPFTGHILDADTHEYTPVNRWEEQFGEIVKPFVDAFESSQMPIRRFVAEDSTEITAQSVWNTKFARAPGAFSASNAS